MFVRSKGENITMVFVYIDDIVLFKNDTYEIAEVSRLASEFEMTDFRIKSFLETDIFKISVGIFL